MSQLKKESFDFLDDLKLNNNRPWFEENKNRYEATKEDFTEFIAALLPKIYSIEPIPLKEPKKYLFRIYRDVRFSKDKSPYKTNMGASIERGPEGKMCGFYLHLENNQCFAGGGIWQPQPDVLKKVRQEIDYNGSDLHKILSDKAFKEMFGAIGGDFGTEKLARPPKGYEADNPNIELLKLKNYVIGRKFEMHDVLSDQFVDMVAETYQTALPFFRFFDIVQAE